MGGTMSGNLPNGCVSYKEYLRHRGLKIDPETGKEVPDGSGVMFRFNEWDVLGRPLKQNVEEAIDPNALTDAKLDTIIRGLCGIKAESEPCRPARKELGDLIGFGRVHGTWGLLKYDRPASGVAFSQDSKYLVTTCKDRTIKLYTRITGYFREIDCVEYPHPGRLTFTKNDDMILVACGNEILKVDFTKKKLALMQYEYAPAMINGIAATKNGERVIIACSDKRCYLLDDNDRLLAQVEQARAFTDVCLSPKEDRVALSDINGTIIYKIDEDRFKFDRLYTDPISLNTIDWGPDDNFAVSTGTHTDVYSQRKNGLVRIANDYTARNGVTDVAFSPDGQYLAAATNDNAIVVYELKREEVKQ